MNVLLTSNLLNMTRNGINRRRLITILFISICTFTNAQYHPFIEPGKTWREVIEKDDSLGHWFLDDYQITGDTVINSSSYKKLEMIASMDPNMQLPWYAVAIREDTTEKTVYVVFPGDSTELLLYDFDLNVGDQHTIHYCFSPGTIPSVNFPYTFKVDSIGNYTDGNGVTRKVWYINYLHEGVVGRIVEGIGSNTGIYAYSCHLYYWGDVACVHNDSAILFVNDPPWNMYCPPHFGSEEKNDDPLGLSLYPNPATNTITIEFDDMEDVSQANVLVLNQSGQMIHVKPVIQDNKIKINISNFPNGLYFLSIRTENNNVTRKIVVLRDYH